MRSRILRRHWYKFRFRTFEVFRRIHFRRHIFARWCRVDSHEDSRTLKRRYKRRQKRR